MTKKPLFNRKVLDREVAKHVRAGRVGTAAQHDVVRKWRDALRTTTYTESNLEQSFLATIFGTVLGYEAFGAGPTHHIVPKVSASGRDFPDFLLGTFSKSQNIERCRAVGELKGAGVNLDLPQASRYSRETPVQQAFRYALNGQPGTEWIIVSNFTELRLYRNGYAAAYHAWHLDEIADDVARFNEFYVLLCRESVAPDDGSVPDTVRLLNASHSEGLKLTEGFYGLYDSARKILLGHLQEVRPNMPLAVLYGKAHKLLNRVLFAAFCEDHPSRLLPANTLLAVHNEAKLKGGTHAYWSAF